MMSIKLKIAAVIAAFCMASAANAATCSINNVSFTLNNAGGAECRAGNDLGWNGIAEQNLEFFSLANWAEGDSTEDGVGDGSVTFASAPLVNSSSGMWSLNSYPGYGPLMIVLRSGHQYGAFLLDEIYATVAAKVYAGLSGTWGIQRNRCTPRGCTMVGKNLTRATVYYSEPAAVPVPAAGFMLLAGLAGLAGLRRRSRKTT